MIPGTIGGKPTRSWLDKILDFIIRDSYFINEPELKKLWWAVFQKHKSTEEIHTLNELRRRVGLREA
jgi:hypothetical protein